MHAQVWVYFFLSMDLSTVFGHGNKYIHLLMFEKYLASSSVSINSISRSWFYFSFHGINFLLFFYYQRIYTAPPIPVSCPDYSDLRNPPPNFGEPYICWFNHPKVSEFIVCYVFLWNWTDPIALFNFIAFQQDVYKNQSYRLTMCSGRFASNVSGPCLTLIHFRSVHSPTLPVSATGLPDSYGYSST